jgi:ankyrin repeat protein
MIIYGKCMNMSDSKEAHKQAIPTTSMESDVGLLRLLLEAGLHLYGSFHRAGVSLYRKFMNMSDSKEAHKQAMITAAMEGDVGTLSVLLEAGLHPDRDFRVGQFQPSPMWLACSAGQLEAAKLLHVHGADINLIHDSDFPMTYLMVAAQGGHREMVAWLLQAGADPHYVRESDGETAYASAVGLGHADIAEMLRVVCDKTLTLDEQLVAAAQAGDVPVAEKLLAAGANHAGKEVGGFNAFMWACINGHAAVVKLFLQHGASPYQEGSDGFSPLQWASMKGRAEVIDVLREADQQLEQRYVPE